MGDVVPLINLLDVDTIHWPFEIDQLLELIAMHLYHDFHFRFQDEGDIHKIRFKFITEDGQGLGPILFQLLQPLAQVGDLLLPRQFVLQDDLIQLIEKIYLAPQQRRICQWFIVGVNLYGIYKTNLIL